MWDVVQLSLRHVHSKKVRKIFLEGKKGLKWLHTYRKMRPYIEREKHFDFSERKGNKRKKSGFPSAD